jgi:signal transduction histidine kinase
MAWWNKLDHQIETTPYPLRPGWIGVTSGYLIVASVIARSLTSEEVEPVLPAYLSFLAVFLILFSIFIWKPQLPAWAMHLYIMVQSAVILMLVSREPTFDFVVVLYVVLTIQVAYYFCGRTRWAWVGILIALTVGSLAYYTGIIQALADTLTDIAAEIVLPAYIILSQEIEAGRVKSQTLINELQETHQQLETYADQVEELSALQERIRLARELHDSVSQSIFSINLNAHSAQLLLKKDPSRLPEQLSRLQELTGEALSKLRSLITQLRPPQQA